MFAKLIVLCVAAALGVGAVARPSGGAAPAQRYTVRPGDTLWSIAVSHYGGDPREAVWKIEQRNGEVADTLDVGETLVLP